MVYFFIESCANFIDNHIFKQISHNLNIEVLYNTIIAPHTSSCLKHPQLHSLNMKQHQSLQKQQYYQQLLDNQRLYKHLQCLRHSKQKITRICVDYKCKNNPLICNQCVLQGFNKSYHYGHQNSIKILEQAIRILAEKIQSQTNPVHTIFKTTLGRNQYSEILRNLEKGIYLEQEISQRIISLKKNIESNLEILLKQFQKGLLTQKQEYFKSLDQYQKNFINNFSYLYSQSQPLLQFQYQLKFYCNKSTLSMKMVSQLQKKTGWVIKLKKVIHEIETIVETPGFISDINKTLSSAHRKQIQALPNLKADGKSQYEQFTKIMDIRKFIKQSIQSWVSLPDLKPITDQVFSRNHENSGTINNARSYGSITKNYYSKGNIQDY